jgi:ACS family hexuronate transporter-like MFS transporter
MAFIVTGALGFLWMIGWWILYETPERHPRLSRSELAYVRSDPPDPVLKISWLELLRYRQTWAFVIGTFLSSPIWWFYLYWIPDFLHKRHGLDLLQLGPPLVAIYLMTDVGSIGGGWLSSWLLRRGWSVNAARKVAMLACAICVVPVLCSLNGPGLMGGNDSDRARSFCAPRVFRQSLHPGLGYRSSPGGELHRWHRRHGGGHRRHVHRQAGGIHPRMDGSYLPLFIIAACAYLINLLIIHLLNPRLEPMQFTVTES